MCTPVRCPRCRNENFACEPWLFGRRLAPIFFHRVADQAPFERHRRRLRGRARRALRSDAPLARGRQVVLFVVETTGAVHPDAIGMLYAWHAEARVEGCIDRTVYGASRTATASFFTHHLRLISLAAVSCDRGAALPLAGLGGVSYRFCGGGFPIRYVSCCIVMYLACIPHVSCRIHVSWVYLDVSQMYLKCSLTFQENTCILIFYMYFTRIPNESKIHSGYT